MTTAIAKVTTALKISLQQEGSQGNKYPNIFLFCSDLLPAFPLRNTSGNQRERTWVIPFIFNAGISENGAGQRSTENNMGQMENNQHKTLRRKFLPQFGVFKTASGEKRLLVSKGCCDKLPPTTLLKTERFILSQTRRLKV